MDDILLEDVMASPDHALGQQSPEASAQPCSTAASPEKPDPIPVIPFELPNHIVRPHVGECHCLWCWRPMLSLSRQDQSPKLKKRSLEFTFPHPENAVPGPFGAPSPFPLHTALPSVSVDESYSWHLCPSRRPPSGVYTARTLSMTTDIAPVLVYTPSRSRSHSAVEGTTAVWGMSGEAHYDEQRAEEEEEEEEEEYDYDVDLRGACPQAYQDYLEESIGSIGSSTLREVNEGASNSDDNDDDDDDDDNGSVASTAAKSTTSLAREDGTTLGQKESPRPSVDSVSPTPRPPPPVLLSDPSRWSESTAPTTASSPVRPNDVDDADDADENEDGDDKEGGRAASPIAPLLRWRWPQRERFLDPRTPTPRPPSPLSASSSPASTSPHPPPPQAEPKRFLAPRAPPTPPPPPANPAPRPVSDARTSLVAHCGSVSGGGGGGGGRRAVFRRGVRNVWGKLIGGVRRGGG